VPLSVNIWNLCLLDEVPYLLISSVQDFMSTRIKAGIRERTSCVRLQNIKADTYFVMARELASIGF